jgi:hypothetical protein
MRQEQLTSRKMGGKSMKRTIIIAMIAFAGLAQGALASNVGVGVDIHIGNQPQVVPVPVPPPPPGPVYIEEPPLFLYPPELGFGVAVGIPNDIFYIAGSYYLYQGDIWYRSPYYNGPWAVTRYRALPPGLRRHRFERIHYYRDRDYREYEAGHDRYHGRHFRPEKERRKMEHDMRKEERREWKEERKRDKEERKHGRHGDRD